MAPRHDEKGRHNLPHLRIERFRRENAYSPPPRRIEPGAHRDNIAHGRALSRQFSTAWAQARASVAAKRLSRRVPGVYIEVAGAQNQKLGDLTWETKRIRMGALRLDPDAVQRAAVFVPVGAEAFLSERIRRYASPAQPGKDASLANRFDSVELFSEGSLTSLWTDMRPFPATGDRRHWFECWTWRDAATLLRQIAARLELRVSTQHLVFPETDIIPVYGSVNEIETLVLLSGAVEQVRFASDSPSFFTTELRREQNLWVEDLLTRIVEPEQHAPAVCLLDGGVAREHPLIRVALDQADCLTVDPSWGTADHEPGGHGTNMAGSILYDDLTYPLSDQRIVTVPFRLESVKFLPPPGFASTEPANYGSITQSAISTVEINAPERRRVFCMAVTNRDVSGERPTSWSASLDQAASGAMVGDREDENEVGPRRLIFVSAGNLPDCSDPDEISDPDEFPVEDPAQAWNVLTVGGFTDKTTIHAAEYANWTPVADAGELSPYSRVSTDWEHSRTPIKPEVVFEAGNKAMSPEQTEILSGIDSLSLLTTNKDFTRESLATFWATSPATAQAAGMAGRISAQFPDLWPETVRALIVHSAEWTPAMLMQMRETTQKRERIALARNFGYGVPSLDRALASAENDLVLLSERTLTPYQRLNRTDAEGRVGPRSPSFRQIDYYDLPWPVASLEALGEEELAVKVTLSYFIEPSPNWDAAIAPQRYQSYGLRFDLKRALETDRQFLERVNNMERGVEPRSGAVHDEGWTFGAQSIAAGSLHCDVWRGSAADLASRGKIAIYPIGGWWRDRIRLRRYAAKTRYALAVTITSREADVELYTEIANLITIAPEI